MPPFERLLKRLLAEGLVDTLPAMEIRRTRAGRWQKAQGAWSWFALDSQGQEVLASHYSVGSLLKFPVLSVTPNHWCSTLEIDPA